MFDAKTVDNTVERLDFSKLDIVFNWDVPKPRLILLYYCLPEVEN